MTLDTAPRLDADAVLDNPRTRIVVCCGSGGVGKTTTAAALGVRAAERGRKVVVLTIDPARRLAQSMGIGDLDNVPRRVGGIDHSAGGELHAMMLDMKRTFDEFVEAHADAARARTILRNPFYQSLSAGFAGTQEYMAMEKLGQLRAQEQWDLIVVDTPPSRSALDFLDAPKRLGHFLDGRFIKMLMAPAKVGGRAGLKFLNAGVSMMTGSVSKLLGGQLLRDVQTFVTAMDTVFGGFRTRADATYRLLQAPGTAFLVVAAPERDALREAAYFVDRLDADRMPLAGLILNRTHRSGADRLSAERALATAETLLELAGGGTHVAPDSGVTRGVGRGPEAPEDESSTDGVPGTTPAPRSATADETGAAGGSGTASRAGARSATEHRAARHFSSDDLDAAPPVAHGLGAEGETGPALAGRTTEIRGGGRADGAAEKPPARGMSGQLVGKGDGIELPPPALRPATTSPQQLAAHLLRVHAERMRLLAREQSTRNRFTAMYPRVPTAEVTALPADVHDLDGLRAVGERLAHQLPEDGMA